jgi:hypothetical protein
MRGCNAATLALIVTSAIGYSGAERTARSQITSIMEHVAVELTAPSLLDCVIVSPIRKIEDVCDEHRHYGPLADVPR